MSNEAVFPSLRVTSRYSVACSCSVKFDSAIIALENDGTIQALYDQYLAPPPDIKVFSE